MIWYVSSHMQWVIESKGQYFCLSAQQALRMAFSCRLFNISYEEDDLYQVSMVLFTHLLIHILPKEVIVNTRVAVSLVSLFGR